MSSNLAPSIPVSRSFPRWTALARSILGLAVALGATGCITSAPWEYGATPDAKALDLSPCFNGMIDNGEDGDAQVTEVDGRDGYWFTFKDLYGSTLEPAKFSMDQGGPPGSRFAAHMHGKMASSGDSLYVGIGFSLTSPKRPYDASRAKGLRFWGKGPGKVRFKAPDANTAPDGDRCTNCYNDFGVDIALEPEWNRYTVPFEKMAQQPGWGDRAPAISTKELFAIQWQYNRPGAEYDIWIDQVELVGCDAGEGAP